MAKPKRSSVKKTTKICRTWLPYDAQEIIKDLEWSKEEIEKALVQAIDIIENSLGSLELNKNKLYQRHKLDLSSFLKSRGVSVEIAKEAQALISVCIEGLVEEIYGES